GRRVLPGAAYLEMARAAVALATRSFDTGRYSEGTAGIQIKNVVWTRPIIVEDKPRRVHIGLRPKDAGEIDYEIYCRSETEGAENLLHGQGSVLFIEAAEAPALNLEKLAARCAKSSLSSLQFYEAFRAIGIDYGFGHQGVEKVLIGPDRVLAKLSLPSSVSDTRDHFVLHPSLIDSALQASMCIAMTSDTSLLSGAAPGPYLPFALQEMNIIGHCTSDMWALIRYGDRSKSGDSVLKVDIDLCDEQGTICVRIEGYASRALKGEADSTAVTKTSRTGKAPAVSESTADSTVKMDADGFLGSVQTALMLAVSKLLGVKTEDMDVDYELSEYGFDSITLTEFANILNQEFGLQLTPVVFFEYPTIHRFAKYLIEAYKERLAPRFQSHRTELLEPPAEAKVEPIPYSKGPRSRFTETLHPTYSNQHKNVPEPLAVVGMSGRFPMAADLKEFWRNLADGKDCIEEIPMERWNWRAFYGDPKKEANKTNVKWGGFIEGIGDFDPLFFGISPKEAELIDPQQRLLMIYVWKAIEDAGYSPLSLSGSNTAIFVGTGSCGYSGLIALANTAIEGHSSTSLVPSVGPNRMSYFLDLHGPSEPIETACSSSLVAVHRGMLAIDSGACDMAVVGGVNTIVTPEAHIGFSKAGMLCEDGRCKTFSNQANGYVRGEGVGMIFLKKLKAAEDAGDHIYGVIRSTAENHGGRANSLTAPNPRAQADLLKTAYLKAGIDPRCVGYIEAHGTGTELGDPVEINGLKTAFEELLPDAADGYATHAFCGLGSVKTNIGHLELAAGIAGVIKVLLQLKHKMLVKSLHCETINPYIDLEESPFYIVRETREWKPLQDPEGRNLPRRAGVSSFGYGGANAHVVIEEYQEPAARGQRSEVRGESQLIVLSAKNEDRLKAYVDAMVDHIENLPKEEIDPRNSKLENFAYTLQVGR
ncbi:MAG: beta-ketoacyl synthase N-terminal-like domain-containing protein, partial [bacterium]